MSVDSTPDQSCKSGRAFRVGPGFGLKFVKMFRADFGPAYKTFYDIQGNKFFLSRRTFGVLTA